MLQLLDYEAPGPAVTEFLIVGDRRAALFPDAGRFQLKGGLPPIEQVAMISPAILEGLLAIAAPSSVRGLDEFGQHYSLRAVEPPGAVEAKLTGPSDAP